MDKAVRLLELNGELLKCVPLLIYFWRCLIQFVIESAWSSRHGTSP
jgi:hypothetical protein